jgi:polyphosphate kinase 2 (PPK2 family)
MFAATTAPPAAPWWTIESDDKRASRINIVSHLLDHSPRTNDGCG